MQLLRVYDLTDALQGDSRELLENLQRITESEPSADKVYAMSELAYLFARKIEKQDKAKALDLYGAAVLHAYSFLFDDRLAATRNCYDPQFRGACVLYNSALEAALRLSCDRGELRPGMTKTIHTSAGTWDIQCVLRGGVWQPADFDHFEFVSDYEMKGLKNHYQTHGLGVPLIVVRRGYQGEPDAARYYPPGLSFPVTAFLRPLSGPNQAGRNQGLLELCDPLQISDTRVGNLLVPLESDLTTPLAYFLSKVPMESLATVGLLQPERLLVPQGDRQTMIKGLYMVQPYEPGKIPVVFIHGMWSSPMTWMEMFNDLRSSPDIRRHYQFWFYLYPTGQPFWLSAAQFRRDLAEMRQVLDPQHREPALDQMVLVGHSMGGLVARLQTLESREDYWNLASRIPLDQVKADADVRQKLVRDVLFPSESVGPPRGDHRHAACRQHLLEPDDAILAGQADSPALGARQHGARAFPRQPRDAFSGFALDDREQRRCLVAEFADPGRDAGQSAGAVGQVRQHRRRTAALLVAAAHAGRSYRRRGERREHRSADAERTVVVPEFHMAVQCHPLAVMEVRRILQEHLDELRGHPVVGLRLAPPPVR